MSDDIPERERLIELNQTILDQKRADEIEHTRIVVFAALAKLSDAELIESARKVAGAGGPLSALVAVLLDRFALHIRRSAEEIERLVRELDGLQRFKRDVDDALNQGDGVYRP